MGIFKQNSLTKITGIFILGVVLFAQFSQKTWNDENDVITADVRGYYAYLPALFIQDDLRLEHPENFASEVWYSENEEGTRFIKYSCGMAIVYSPFFLIAHTLAEPMGAPANGYSYPYKFALAMSAIVYLIIALIFLSKLLLRYFSDSVVSITLLILFLGTNALHYYTGNMTYSHGYSLTLISVFLYCAVRWIERPAFKWAIWIGITTGLFVLIRPIDVLFILFLPLFNLTSFEDLKLRFALFWKKKYHVIVMLLLFFLMLLPQLLYFKSISGSFLFYSYTGEPFYFGNPHLFDSILSYRNGWLVYSPLMVLSILGLFFIRKQKAAFGAFLLPVSLLYFYVISAWWCWWYVGFGNRAFINLYPILAISLACFVQFAITGGRLKRVGFKVFVLFGLMLSAFQTYQYDVGGIHWGAMTKDAFWSSFLREKPSQTLNNLLRYPVTEQQILGKDIILAPSEETIYTINYSFDNTNSCDSTMLPFLQFDEARNGKGALRADEGMEYLGKIPISVKDVGALYITAWVKDLPDQVNLGLSRIEPFYYHSSSEVAERKGDWSKIHMLGWVPVGFGADSVDFILWNQGKHAFILDDLQIKAVRYSYSEKER
jgi:hypothetical protein